MLVAGFDPSSSCSAAALVDGNLLARADVWKRPSSGSAPARLLYYFDWLTGWLLLHQPHAAVIEFLSVERNAKTTRILSHYQGVTAVVCKRHGCVVIESRAVSVRKIVCGKGNLKKDEVYEQIVGRFPEFEFLPFDSGGGDQTDATVLALAGPSLLEQS